MNSKRFVGIFAAIFLTAAIPLMLVQPSGVASAGLSAGFVAPLNNVYHLVLMMLVGLAGTLIGRAACVMLPICFMLMMLIGSSLTPVFQQYPLIHFLLLGEILLFAIAVSVVGSRVYLVSVIFASAIAYELGTFYAKQIPDIAPPLYFLLGNQVCVVLLLATGVSLGYSIAPEIKIIFQKFRHIPSVSAFIALFF